MPKPQTVLEVLERTELTPHMVRLTLGGKNFSDFPANAFTDQYVKLVFAKPELKLQVPFDLQELRRTLPPEDVPVTRTYTVRRVDHQAQTIDIDFVVHGDQGLAGPWAQQAQPGQSLVLMGPGGKFSPDPTADWHLFAGDPSSFPAISSALEALPETAKALVFLTVDEESERQELVSAAEVELVWAVGGTAADSDRLVRAMESRPWPEGRAQAFVHGEREAVKKARRLLKERGVAKEDLSVSAYWAHGRTEDRFQAEKREPIGQIED